MESNVDSFLIQALENPCHRLTILRMELDIQKFMKNSNQQQFEFDHFPTSYLRCAAHRVAQHYGLQTFSQNMSSNSSKIVAIKTPESKFPTICLSEIHQNKETDTTNDQVKIAICKRPTKESLSERTELKHQKVHEKTVEDRKEEYEKARARIFKDSSSIKHAKEFCFDKCEIEYSSGFSDENEKLTDEPSKVARFRRKEVDRWDPDYDRSYDRYAKGPTIQNWNSRPFDVMHSPYVQSEACYPITQIPTAIKAPIRVVTPLCAFGCHQITTKEAICYMPWSFPTMMYAQSYGQFGNPIFQVSPYQHCLSNSIL